nr:hypothetical protein [Tanacetum cinerariifolium]
MSISKFDEVHNMVVFLSKPTESEEFEQIIDFLNAYSIKYAVTVNPIIYTSCSHLQFVDKGGVDCLPNEVIFEQLTLIGLEGMLTHHRIYVLPSHTKKIFRNMKRVGKGFSGKDTPLFPTMMVQAQEEIGEGSTHPTDPHLTPTIIQPSISQPQKKKKSRKPRRQDTKIAKTQSKATSNESSSQRTDSGDGPMRQDTMGDTIAQTRSKNVSKISNDPLLAGVNTPQSGEDSLKLTELIKLCTTLQSRVLALEATKTTQVQEIDSLKRRVKKLEKKQSLRTHKLKRLYQVRFSARLESSNDEGLGEEDASKQERIIDNLDADKDIKFLNDQEMLNDHKDLQGEEVVVKQDVVADKDLIVDATRVSVAATTVTINDITLAKALEALKTSNPKIKRTVIKDHEEPSESRTTTIISSKNSQDKDKAKMIEQPVKLNKKDQILFDEEVARKLQEEINEEERPIGERAR